MADEGCLPSFLVLAAMVAGVWYFFGEGEETIASWRGQTTYEYRSGKLADFVNANQIGAGADVWLAKHTFGTPDRVALFFGYLDDWGSCTEVAQMLNQRYPGDNFSCIYASQQP